MTLFLACLGTVLAIVALTLTKWNAYALIVGILVGAFYYLRGIAVGGGLGNARSFGQKPADVNARIGICLAAAGIASASLGHDPPFPLPFRVFYGVCLALGCLIALVLAGKRIKPS